MIEVGTSAYKINRYHRGDNVKLENSLSIYNKTYYRNEDYGFIIDELEAAMYIPRGFDIELVRAQFPSREFKFVKPNSYKYTDFGMKTPPRNNDQKRVIAFLSGVKDYRYTEKFNQLMVDMETGTGKTFCTLAALSIYKRKALIINYDIGTQLQWVRSMKEHTTLMDEDIVVLTSKICNDIWEGNIDVSHKSMFLCTHDTIRMLSINIGWGNVNEFMIKLGIGVKVYDEADMRIESIYKLDAYTQISKTFYLTATTTKSNRFEDAIYKMTFGAVPKCGRELFENSQKDIVAIIISTNSKPSIMAQSKCKKKEGFSSAEYCSYAYGEDRPVYKFIKWAIGLCNKTIKEHEQVCIYAYKKDSNKLIKEFLINEMNIKDDDILLYNSGNTSKNKDTDLLKKKYIISTTKSMGRAKDLPNLRACIMTEAFSSQPIMSQTLGRLRNGGFYIEMLDKGFKSIDMQFKSRKKIIDTKCIKIITSTLNL